MDDKTQRISAKYIEFNADHKYYENYLYVFCKSLFKPPSYLLKNVLIVENINLKNIANLAVLQNIGMVKPQLF